MRISLIAVLALAGCKQLPDVPTIISPYRIDIQQGNVVTQDMVSKLKIGMTRAQVRFALGSPLVIDPFRTDRWDYVYSLQKQGREVERRRVTVIFDDDKLLRIEGDVVPADGTKAADSEKQKPPAATAVKPAPAKPAAAATAKPAAAQPEVASPGQKPPGAPPPPNEPAVADMGAAPAADAAKGGDSAASSAAAAVPPEAAKSEGAKPGARTGPAGAAKADAAKTDAAKADAGKEKPKERGFFGRMMDKMGF